MKMTTLCIPVLFSVAMGIIGFSQFGGSTLFWMMSSWFAIVPVTFGYVALLTEQDLKVEKRIEA